MRTRLKTNAVNSNVLRAPRTDSGPVACQRQAQSPLRASLRVCGTRVPLLQGLPSSHLVSGLRGHGEQREVKATASPAARGRREPREGLPQALPLKPEVPDTSVLDEQVSPRCVRNDLRQLEARGPAGRNYCENRDSDALKHVLKPKGHPVRRSGLLAATSTEAPSGGLGNTAGHTHPPGPRDGRNRGVAGGEGQGAGGRPLHTCSRALRGEAPT